MYKYDIAASIVAYKNEPSIINNAIQSFLDTDLNVCILIIDNSPSSILQKKLIKDERVHYIFNEKNVGFSKAHNQGINYFKNQAEYFLVLNPDVYFDKSTLSTLHEYLELHSDVGLIAPRVLYPDGRTQTSRRLIPAPVDLFIRRIPFGHFLFRKRTRVNEYQDTDDTGIQEVPFLLGCFLLFRMTALKTVGLFDERYFVYLEDLDICRRIGIKFKVVYHGKSIIYHLYQRASSKSLEMLLLHTISMIKYFNKWGWLSDSVRREINEKAITHKDALTEEEYSLIDSQYATSL